MPRTQYTWPGVDVSSLGWAVVLRTLAELEAEAAAEGRPPGPQPMRRVLDYAIESTTWVISDGMYYQKLVPHLEQAGLVETVYPDPRFRGAFTPEWHGAANRRAPYLQLTDAGRAHLALIAPRWTWPTVAQLNNTRNTYKEAGAPLPLPIWADAVMMLTVALDRATSQLVDPLPGPGEILQAAMDDRIARKVKARRHYDPWAGLMELLAYLVILEFDLQPSGEYEPSTMEKLKQMLGWSVTWPSEKALDAVAKMHPVHAWAIQQEIQRLTELLEAEKDEKQRAGFEVAIRMLSRYALGLAEPVSPADWPAEREARRRRAAPRIARAAAVSLWAGQIVAEFVTGNTGSETE